MTPPSHAELARVVRTHAGRLAAALMPLVGDFSAAERSNIADQLEHLAAGTVRPVEDEPVDAARAAGVLRTVAFILGGDR